MSNNISCKIVVGVNSLTNTTHAAYSNHMLFSFSLGRMFPNIQFIWVNPSRMGIDRMRNMCAKVAIDNKADYILFLDDDVLVPNDCLEKLLAADGDIVVGDVLIRGYPFDHMAFRYSWLADNEDDQHRLIGINKWEGHELGRVVEVDAVGFSLALLKVETLKKVPEPWFITGSNNTEDIYYCIKMRANVPDSTIKCDTSIPCGHILGVEAITPQNKEAYTNYLITQGLKTEKIVGDFSGRLEDIKRPDTYEKVIKREVCQ